MKIVINTSTISVGGAVQVAVNVIRYSFNLENDEVYYVTNSHLYKLIPVDSKRVLVVDKSPATIFKSKSKKEIIKYIDSIKPDVIYSVGAPSYINFKFLEVLRLTNPWIINKLDSDVFKIFSFLKSSILKAKIIIQRRFLKNTRYFITQTEDARNKIINNLGKNPQEVFVIPNTISSNLLPYFNKSYIRNYVDKINVLIIAAPYPHKNLEITLKVAKILKENNNKKYKFIVTVPVEFYQNTFLYKEIKKYGLEDYFENVGKVNLSELPSLFERSHILLLPTLLEVFSVSLLEAMLFKLPIITTKYSFNLDVCKSAAVYIEDPFDPSEILKHIIDVSTSIELRDKLIKRGVEILNEYISDRDIYKEHFAIIKEIISYENAFKQIKE